LKGFLDFPELLRLLYPWSEIANNQLAAGLAAFQKNSSFTRAERGNAI